MKLGILVVTYQSELWLSDFFKSVVENVRELSSSDVSVSLLVLDNASTDGTREQLALWKQKSEEEGVSVELILNAENEGFSKAANRGVQFLKEEMAFEDEDRILVLNPDGKLGKGMISSLWKASQDLGADALLQPCVYSFQSPKKLVSAGNRQHVLGMVICDDRSSVLERLKEQSVLEVSFVSGAAFLTSMALWQRLRGFDERYFLYYEDSDLSRRALRLGASLYVLDTPYFHNASSRLSPRRIWHYFWGWLRFMRPSRFFSSAE